MCALKIGNSLIGGRFEEFRGQNFAVILQKSYKTQSFPKQFSRLDAYRNTKPEKKNFATAKG